MGTLQLWHLQPQCHQPEDVYLEEAPQQWLYLSSTLLLQPPNQALPER